MKQLYFPVIGIVSMLFAGSCTKDPLDHLSQDESRIYITKHDDSSQFGSYTTFSIVDSVAVIENNQFKGRALAAVDAAYINAIRNLMQQRGYAEVPRDQNPDLAVSVNRIYNTYTGVFSYGDYWNYYYGYWDPFYWGYPGFSYFFPPFYYGFYEITEGALSIDLFDLMNANDSKNIRAVWNGLIRGSGVFREDKAASNVQILFDQSKYLQTN